MNEVQISDEFAEAQDRLMQERHIVAAVWRLTADPEFVAIVSEIVEARRMRSDVSTGLAASKLFWHVEAEIVAQVRREMGV